MRKLWLACMLFSVVVQAMDKDGGSTIFTRFKRPPLRRQKGSWDLWAEKMEPSSDERKKEEETPIQDSSPPQQRFQFLKENSLYIFSIQASLIMVYLLYKLWPMIKELYEEIMDDEEELSTE